MARIRTIKPEFWTSEQIVSCSRDARLLFIGMFNFADDRGVLPDSPRRIKMQVFPGDDVAEIMEVWLRELETQGLTEHYVVDGKGYIRITGWAKHQKISHPNVRHPLPSHSVNTPEPSVVIPETSGVLREAAPQEGKGREGSRKGVKDPPIPPLGADSDGKAKSKRKAKLYLIPTIYADPMFAQFWAEFPIKGQSKQNAALAFDKVVNGNELVFDEVMSGLKGWKASKRWQEGYVKDVAAWLSGAMFRDEPPAPPQGQHKLSPELEAAANRHEDWRDPLDTGGVFDHDDVPF